MKHARFFFSSLVLIFTCLVLPFLIATDFFCFTGLCPCTASGKLIADSVPVLGQREIFPTFQFSFRLFFYGPYLIEHFLPFSLSPGRLTSLVHVLVVSGPFRVLPFPFSAGTFFWPRTDLFVFLPLCLPLDSLPSEVRRVLCFRARTPR